MPRPATTTGPSRTPTGRMPPRRVGRRARPRIASRSAEPALAFADDRCRRLRRRASTRCANRFDLGDDPLGLLPAAPGAVQGAVGPRAGAPRPPRARTRSASAAACSPASAELRDLPALAAKYVGGLYTSPRGPRQPPAELPRRGAGAPARGAALPHARGLQPSTASASARSSSPGPRRATDEVGAQAARSAFSCSRRSSQTQGAGPG
jgi:hypothetical protein